MEGGLVRWRSRRMFSAFAAWAAVVAQRVRPVTWFVALSRALSLFHEVCECAGEVERYAD